jgi:single-strand DNA-binding protein
MENVKNSVRLTGFAGSDPIVINFANQKKMARVSLAVNEFYKNSAGEPVNQTQWFNLVFWNKKADLAEKSIVKGTHFSVEGKLVTQSYTDKKGEQRYTVEISVNTIQLAGQDEDKLFVVVK